MEIPVISSNQLEEQMLTRLFDSWRVFVSQLQIDFEPAKAIPLLEKFAIDGFDKFKLFGEHLIQNCEFRKSSEFELGMNSPGILWDRLTILNCKLLFTGPDSIHHKPLLHKNLGNVSFELKSVMQALNNSHPARNILLAKEATDRQLTIDPLETSLWSLQMSNIAMWINQDLLYTASADDVDPQRLRDYIKFFSKANRIRNSAIENIELFYTRQLQRN